MRKRPSCLPGTPVLPAFANEQTLERPMLRIRPIEPPRCTQYNTPIVLHCGGFLFGLPR